MVFFRHLISKKEGGEADGNMRNFILQGLDEDFQRGKISSLMSFSISADTYG
jgi:hypothetical protein